MGCRRSREIGRPTPERPRPTRTARPYNGSRPSATPTCNYLQVGARDVPLTGSLPTTRSGNLQLLVSWGRARGVHPRARGQPRLDGHHVEYDSHRFYRRSWGCLFRGELAARQGRGARLGRRRADRAQRAAPRPGASKANPGGRARGLPPARRAVCAGGPTRRRDAVRPSTRCAASPPARLGRRWRSFWTELLVGPRSAVRPSTSSRPRAYPNGASFRVPPFTSGTPRTLRKTLGGKPLVVRHVIIYG